MNKIGINKIGINKIGSQGGKIHDMILYYYIVLKCCFGFLFLYVI